MGLSFLQRRNRSLAAEARAYMRTQPIVQPAGLPALLERASAHLGRKFPKASAAETDAAALAAWAELAGDATRCYVDLEASTPHLVILVDPVAGVRRPFPAADLVRLLGPRAAV